MIEVGDLRKGHVIQLEGNLYRVVEVNKHFMGRGSGIIRSRLKNIQTGYITEKTFSSGERVEEAELTFRQAEYLYFDGDHHCFMDLGNYEQYLLEPDIVEDAIGYLKENMEVVLLFHDERILGIQLPTSVVLEVTQTDPNFKGDTVSGGGKPALLETGMKVTVPMFIENGQKIRVDTRTGEYLERA